MTFSWEIDDVESLQLIVKRELKNLGIRISKKKDVNRSFQAHSANTLALFGKTLKAYSIIKDESSHCCVPRFLVECITFLDKHLKQEGIFRVSGSKARQKLLQQKLENGHPIPQDANAADVCSLFKQFFRSLPEPLLTPRLQSALLKGHQSDDATEQRWIILNICYLLPPLHLQTLRFLMLFLHKVGAQNEHNRMDASNLAKVFTPNIMGEITPADKKNPDRVIALQTSVVKVMIENAKLIGEVPDWMMDRVMIAGHGRSREHLDRLTSEDELEKSDDNLEDSSRSVKRRRRKSGSSFQVLVNGLGHSLGIRNGPASANERSFIDSISSETPKIMKRKASEDLGGSVLSSKRKAMLHKMTVDPQFSKPGLHLHKSQPQGSGTPVTPLQPARPALGETDAITADGETLFRFGTPSIVYADDSFAGHTPSRLAMNEMIGSKGGDHWQETPKSKLRKFKELSAKKLKRRSIVQSFEEGSSVSKSSKGSKTPLCKKKDTKDVGWRLANASPPEGALDTMKLFEAPVRPSPDFSSPSRQRRHVKAPSSPARLLTGASPDLPQPCKKRNVEGWKEAHTPVRQGAIRFSAGESPRVLIVDMHDGQAQSPKVVVVDTHSAKGEDLTEEYVKNQQVHTSHLIGRQLGKERISPSVTVSQNTREKIKAAESVYTTLDSDDTLEAKRGPGMANLQASSMDKEQTAGATGKPLMQSVSQVSLSSVLSGISSCSQKSEFSQFGVEALASSENQQQAPYLETAIGSPCVVECVDATTRPQEDPVRQDQDGIQDVDTKHSFKTAETCNSTPGNASDEMCSANAEPICTSGKSDIGRGQEEGVQELIRTVKDSSSPPNRNEVGLGDSVTAPAFGKLSKSESQDSGKGCSMEDLNEEEGDKHSLNSGCQAQTIVTEEVDVGIGVGEGEAGDVVENGDVCKRGESNDCAEIVGKLQVEDEGISKGDCTANCDDFSGAKSPQEQSSCGELLDIEMDKEETKMGSSLSDSSIGQDHGGRDQDIFKIPGSCAHKAKDKDVYDIVEALRSDLKKAPSQSQTLPVAGDLPAWKGKHNASIVKANIKLFNSISASHQELDSISRGVERKPRTRGGSQREPTIHPAPRTPLTKSTSMDSGICNVTATMAKDLRRRDMNDSFLAAVGGEPNKKTVSSSASMEDISTPKQTRSGSSRAGGKSRYPIRGSQSMQDISTPTHESQSLTRRSERNTKVAPDTSVDKKGADLASTPKKADELTTPRSIKRRRPVSQKQRTAFLERESFAKLQRQKSFDKGEGEAVTPPVKPLGDNNSPQLGRPRRPAPLDPRRATPLTPVHLAQRTRIRGQGGRKAVIKHRSPVKPVKRLGKSPSPARSRHTPERENRTPKQYPRSPRNPLTLSSPQTRKSKSAVPVHVREEWEL
ncbi:uncharacterized protein [Diadema antillarum]|uniref:uncharacterized protein n=1 Tax=Diadema antillarum TaxID=105358 RepID=UPI003A870BD0